MFFINVMTATISIPPRVISMIQLVEHIIGSPVYLVGGAVRDILLGCEPADYDFCTAALPEEVEMRARLYGSKAYTIGKRFGTIGFKITLPNQPSEYIEVTTFRSEHYNSGSRLPHTQYETDILEDLKRRDLTINAIALDSSGSLIDPHHGQDDINNKLIRTVGNPKSRFREDALRLLRVARFKARLGFDIEENTFKQMFRGRFGIMTISNERCRQEITKLLMSDHADLGLDILMETKLLSIIIPPLSIQYNYNQNSPWHDFTLWEHTKKVVMNTPQDDMMLRWAALLHDVAKPASRTENPKGHSNYIGHDLIGAKMATQICKELKFSNAETKAISELILNHLNQDSPLKPYDDAGKLITK